MIKIIPNTLSIFRILFSGLLIVSFPYKTIFILIYLLSGLTDVLDGFIARKYNIETKLGAKLDSIADIAFYTVLLIIFFVWFRNILIEYKWLIIITITIRISTIIIGIVKYKNIVFIHTVANKITGLMIYCIPIYIFLLNSNILILVTTITSIISALEEFLIMLIFKKVELNKKGIFCK
ncbi:CDP-alcohol phosphatidyltransferase family protein [Halocella sp. SP3-1]|uniref:CDP-alcohol phosphatidyltransferase family protein n=1 Tax=Halocella sp. SP3-1 TaxID=2382161 RepID=UPI000F75FE2A|nr:CDP-alcohol phosphatidyltransferase family protein [Halocella sp. SP3-1]AZO95375.1 CDP-alcohol phosphatidyltransferase family protein [Halocella sp. SP3-1]